MTPQTIKMFVMMYVKTIIVLINAILSASALSAEAFSPKDFAHILQKLLTG